MDTKSTIQLTIIVALLYISSATGYKVNITKFGNCDDVTDVKVKLTKIQYTYNAEGLCDTVHGKYYVYSRDPGIKYELWITLFECPTNSLNQCNDNGRHFAEPLTCDRFHNDNKGPWYMISKAIEGSKCGESIGEFELKSTELLPAYLEDYLVFDPNLARHRLHMLFHKSGENGDLVHARGCVNIEFTLIN